MKYGMPTMVELDGLHACVRKAKELGLDFIEINMSFPEYTRENLNTAEARALSEKYGIFYTIHADEGLNPFDFNRTVSDCYFEVMKDTVAVAKEIGAKVINLHLQKGIYVTLPGRVILLSDVYRDRYMESVKRFIETCESEISDSDIIICIENVDSNPFSSSQIDALELFMKSEKFALTLDTGHECKLKGADTPIFLKYPEKLLHMHLHDCIGGSPHLPLGVGEVNIKEKLSSLRGSTCLIEVKTVSGIEESVKYIKEGSIF